MTRREEQPLKTSTIEKTLHGGDITDDQLAAIHRYTRRDFAKEELFVFSLILCDNEIDRDGERFPTASLETLCGLYKGKTGIFDHRPQAEHQAARIFDAAVEAGEGKNSLGEDYRCLRAWAYMVRCDKNRDLILEIDGGIKKEVSVGCAVEKTVCSICGADQKAEGCTHKKGETYGDKRCHHLLLNPTDAYEWSFVAVPAQKNAGVVKALDKAYTLEREVSLEKLCELNGDAMITKAQLDALGREYRSLKAFAAAGEDYYRTLRKEAVRAALLSHPEMNPALMEEIASGLDLEKLREWIRVFGKSAEKALPPRLQLAAPTRKESVDAQFVI